MFRSELLFFLSAISIYLHSTAACKPSSFVHGFRFLAAQDIEFQKNALLLPCGLACVSLQRSLDCGALPSTCSANILVNSSAMLALLWLQSSPLVCEQLCSAWTEGSEQTAEGHTSDAQATATPVGKHSFLPRLI